MYENDYILRMVRQIAEVIAKLILNKEIKNYDLCHEITNTAFKENFGLSKELFLRLPVKSIEELIGRGCQSEALFSLAQLLLNEGEVFKAEGNIEETKIYYIKSLDLLEYIDDDEEDLELKEYIAKLQRSLESLDLRP